MMKTYLFISVLWNDVQQAKAAVCERDANPVYQSPLHYALLRELPPETWFEFSPTFQSVDMKFKDSKIHVWAVDKETQMQMKDWLSGKEPFFPGILVLERLT